MIDPSEIKTNILRLIGEHGFTAVAFHGTEDMPAVGYTIGLCAKTKDQREIIVLGLPQEVAIEVLNTIGRRLLEGEDLPLRKDIARVFVDFPARLVPVNAKKFGEYGRHANWYARQILKRDRNVQALQLLWPDRFGMWPGTPGATHRRSQPLL